MRAFLASLIFSFILIFGAGAQSPAEPQVIRGLFCDKVEQAETFIYIVNKTGKGHAEALEETNKVIGEERACAFAIGLAFVGEQMGNPHDVAEGEVVIKEVLLIGVMTPNGPIRVEPPAVQYTFFLIPSQRS